MRRAVRLPEPPPQPLASDEDESDSDFGELLPGLDEEKLDDDEPGLDEAEDFDIDPPLADVTYDDQTAPDLRFGNDSVLPEADEEAEGDAAGFDAEPRTSESALEDALPSDDEEREGIDDERPLVSDLDLPGLDADDDGGDGDAARFGAFLAASELAWPSAQELWQVTRLSPERERCSALAVGQSTVVAGSTDLLWLDPGRSATVRLALDGARVVSLALLGEAEDTIVAVTATGRVLRRARLASDSERVGDLGRSAEDRPRDTRGTELCALGPSEPHALLLHSTLRPLERSDDAGNSFFPIEPRLFPIALSSSAKRVAALVDSGRELALSHDAGKSFERQRLGGIAGGVALGDAPLLAAAGTTVAIVDPERGLVLSTDYGATFREIPGCAGTTACAVGVHDGRTYAWLALYSEAADVTRIVMVDAGRTDAEIIAKFAGSGDDEELGASARVERLGWDGTRLFAAGELGFVLIEPPSAEPRH
jgi:hypothetical protein